MVMTSSIHTKNDDEEYKYVMLFIVNIRLNNSIYNNATLN